MLEGLRGEVALVHHWDTDGICSAAMLLKELKNVNISNWTPILGAFYLTTEQIDYLGAFNNVIIVDMALPPMNVLALSKHASVTVIDHHFQSQIKTIHHFNPVASGASPEDYPSCTWVIREYLGQSVSLLTVLGLVGDLGSKINSSPEFLCIVEEYCTEYNTSYEELLRMVQLIDSNYNVGDRKGVHDAPWKLLEASPVDILNNKEWLRNKEKFDEKVEEILSEHPEEVEGVLFRKLDTSYNVISTITRRIEWGYGRNTVVVNTGFFIDRDQVYARSESLDMRPMVSRAKELGFNAGGKKDVMGAIIPKKSIDKFLREVISYLKK
jgi:single-stranded DNA-specific DHH superfamily exonuclease